MKSVNLLLHKKGLDDSQSHSTVCDFSYLRVSSLWDLIGDWLFAEFEGTVQHLQVVTPNKSMIRRRTPAALPT